VSAGRHADGAAKFEDARDIYHQIGAGEPWSERLTALAQQPLLQARPGTAYPDGLSEREVEVLRLIASGKSNPEIAEALVISVNTVYRHVSHIFDKTGVSNRVEAAGYAQHHGFV
jgi:DNA-binding NarL/FixJ family response regulator